MKEFSKFDEDDEQPETRNAKNIFGFEASSMDRTRLASGIRLSLLLFLIAVFIGGLAILGIGIWTSEGEYGSKQLSTLIGVALYRVDSFMLMIGGGAIMGLTLIGLCGVLIPYKCLLGLHLGILSFMALMLFVAGVLGYVLIGELEDKVKDTLELHLSKHYGVHTDQNQFNRVITESWDHVQETFHCCGAHGDANSTTSWALYREKSNWYKYNISHGNYVPKSCCGPNNRDLCTGSVDVKDQPPRHGPPVPGNINLRNYTLYTDGCFDILESHLRNTGIVIGTAAIVVGVFMLVELVLSFCMYRKLH
ncbi:CD151 antigen-like [Gigantopelta aegis]|uniref:CD151 antigen-like n=1 Tax=Gigantopelta aegis TaxID=1735272 RepID=UPI001B88A8A2|nr:CD151 antigen-like [Gigantopelta aegis]XP_041359128.1 CD151 antigen-like [Gigantopelta aegis]